MTHPLLGAGAIKLELDNGTGTFPYDITAYLDLKAGYSIKRGRPDQFSTVQASELNCTLKNNDGRFTVGSVTYNVFIDQRIRLTETIGATTSVRFTGYVSGWPVSWEGGPAKISSVRVQAFDAFPRLQRAVLKSTLASELSAMGTMSLFTFGEPVGSQVAANSGSGSSVPLTVPSGGTAPTFGVTGIPAGTDMTSATFPAGTVALSNTFTMPASGVTAGFTVQTSYVGASPSPILSLLLSGLGLLVALQSGKVVLLQSGGGSTITGPTIADGLPHQVVFTLPPSGNLSLYVDGSLVSSVVATTVASSGSAYQFGVSSVGSPGFFTFANAFSVAGVSAVATYAATQNSLTAGLVPVESSSDRLIRLARYAGIAASDVVTETSVLTSVPAQTILDQNPLPAMQLVADAEGGLVFVRGDGKLVLQNRYHRAQRVAANLTLTTDDLTTDLEVEYDMDEVTNYATGMRALITSSSDAPTLVSQSATSIATHGQYPNSLTDLLVTTDSEVQDRLDWTVNRYGEPFPRLPDAKIDLLTCISAKQQSALGLELSDRLSIGTLPSQAPTVGDLVVEGWTETVSISEWSMAVNASPFSVVAAFTPDDPVYGIPDSPLAPVSF